MNIISDSWIPARRRSGAEGLIRPAQIAEMDDPPISLLWPRPDFEFACLELLIGLTYAAMPPESDAEWRTRANEDLHGELESALAKLARWFELDGDGPRFMQDMEALEAKPGRVDKLLIDSAGEKTVSNNADMMVRRERYGVLGRPAAAMALYTLQSFAPAGGSGIRTSMRGGGPLVTLIEPAPGATLWEIVYANTPSGSALGEEDASVAFPWTMPTKVSSDNAVQIHEPPTAADAPHWGAFFGMPRRINLVFENREGICDLTSRKDERLVTGVVQQKQGNNYGLWAHPCSPYYRMKTGAESLPRHPKPGRLGYRQFVGLSLRDQEDSLNDVARCVKAYGRRASRKRQLRRLIVGGWSMDNMKPVDFVRGHAPLPVGDGAETVESSATHLVRAADCVAGELAKALKNALTIDEFDKGVVAQARMAFYDATETAFFEALDRLVADPDSDEAGVTWRAALEREASGLFDEHALPGVTDLSPERAARVKRSRDGLRWCLKGYGKSGETLFYHLHLDPPPKKTKKRRTGAKA